MSAAQEVLIVTGTSSYTHLVCPRCSKVLYCSEAEPFEQQDWFGWCDHGDEPVAVQTDFDPMSTHDCNGEML